MNKYNFIIVRSIDESVFLNHLDQVEYLIENVNQEKLKMLRKDVNEHYCPLKYLHTEEIEKGNKKIKNMFKNDDKENDKKIISLIRRK